MIGTSPEKEMFLATLSNWEENETNPGSREGLELNPSSYREDGIICDIAFKKQMSDK